VTAPSVLNLPSNVVCGVFGKRGYGKSTLCRALLSETAGRRLVIDPLDEYPEFMAVDDWAEFEQALQRQPGGYRWRIVPGPETNMDVVFQLAYRVGDMTIMIEETRQFQSVHTLSEPLRALALWGRHRKVTLVVVGQRPVLINADLFSQIEVLYLFRITDHRDLATLSNYIDDSALHQLSSLQVGEFLRVEVPDTYTVHRLKS
jgi:hypothetical protein